MEEGHFTSRQALYEKPIITIEAKKNSHKHCIFEDRSTHSTSADHLGVLTTNRLNRLDTNK